MVPAPEKVFMLVANSGIENYLRRAIDVKPRAWKSREPRQVRALDRGPGGRRSPGAVQPGGDDVLVRLQGTAALQANNGHRSLDHDLEGEVNPSDCPRGAATDSTAGKQATSGTRLHR
jgi:hypothetical protein